MFSATLAANQSTTVLMAIDFNDTTQPAKFDICSQTKKFNVNISAPVGELLQPNTLTENDFKSLQGMCQQLHNMQQPALVNNDWDLESYEGVVIVSQRLFTAWRE